MPNELGNEMPTGGGKGAVGYVPKPTGNPPVWQDTPHAMTGYTGTATEPLANQQLQALIKARANTRFQATAPSPVLTPATVPSPIIAPQVAAPTAKAAIPVKPQTSAQKAWEAKLKAIKSAPWGPKS